MSYTFNALAVVLAFTFLTAGCSKKSSKGSRAARPAKAGSTAEATTPAGELPAPSEAELERPSASRAGDETPASPSRFSEQERSRFDNSRSTEVPGPPEHTSPDTEIADATGAPDLQNEPLVDTSETGGVARNSQCGTAYRRTSEQWAPGLPNAPAEVKICTGGTVRKMEDGQQFSCDKSADQVFTDSRQDGLMALAVDHANRVPKHMDQGSRELARRIRDVKISSSRNSREVQAQVQLLVAEKQYEKFEFRGAMKNSNGGEAGIRMIPTNSPRGLKFSAVLTCADGDGSCTNGILRLQQLTRSGKVGRLAYIVIRSGDAHVTISDQDRLGFRTIENKEHAQFAEYLSNTSHNTCVSILRETANGMRQLPACAYQRLKAICGRKGQFKRPAAQAFEFNSWAVAYGRSGFEFEMIDRETARFIVKGPLVAGISTPVWPRALKVNGAFAGSIERAILVANDGGGNLNLQIDFKGAANSHTRISVTTLIEDIRYSSEAVVARARQMPALSNGDIAADEELRDDEREDRGERRRLAPAGRPVPHVGNRPLPPNPKPAPAAKPAPSAKPAVGRPAPVAKPVPVAKPTPAASKGKPALPPNPDTDTLVPKPAPGKSEPGPRFEAPPANPPAGAGVPAREEEDNQVVQPRRDEAPQTPPPDSDQSE